MSNFLHRKSHSQNEYIYHEVVPAHSSHPVTEFLIEYVAGKYIGHIGVLINWPSRSSEIIPLECCLCRVG